MKQTLEGIFNKLKENGYKIVAPCNVDGKVFFSQVNSVDEIVLDCVNTDLAVKEWFFPRTEVVMEYKNHLTNDVQLEKGEDVGELTAIIGVRPCDAKSLLVLDKVFSWDYKDDFYFKRRENTLLVVHICKELGENCFCEELGLNMSSVEGADIVLEDSGSGDFNVSITTEKGNKIFPEEKIETGKSNPPAGKTIGLEKIKTWLDDNFENDFWENLAQKCLGCGICAFVCPTCHCFDIVDEALYTKGCRRKNWDSCCFTNFTLHTSGHNPRPFQKERFRNRIMHKFKYYKDKFDETACVGCGRCKSACPVSMDLKSILGKIENVNK